MNLRYCSWPGRFKRWLICMFASPFALISTGRAEMLVGVAKVDITPDYAIRLNGYLARKTESEGVIQRIHAKALAFGSDREGPALLLSLDNCILPPYVREQLGQRLASRGIRIERLAICASHTHSAPKLTGAADNIFGVDIPPEQQAKIDRYSRELIDRLEQVSLAALAARQPAALSWGRTTATFAANRRTKDGPVDHDLPLMVVKDARGVIRALVTSYACHCTTLGPEPNKICGDWAGYAQEYLEAEHPGAVALTLIGCGADANPAPRPGVELAQQHGRALAAAVNARLAQSLVPIRGALECRVEQFELPLDRLPTRAEWEAAAAKNDPAGYHARKNLARLDRGERLPESVPYVVQVWNFGRELSMVFLAGEVVVDYSLRLKRELDRERLWVNAYANTIPCYIPSQRVWREGGYEGAKAMIYYDVPTRLVENTEEIIIERVRRLVPREFESAPAKK